MKGIILVLLMVIAFCSCYSEPINVIGTYQSDKAFINFDRKGTVTFYYSDTDMSVYNWYYVNQSLVSINNFVYKVYMTQEGCILEPQFGESTRSEFLRRY